MCFRIALDMKNSRCYRCLAPDGQGRSGSTVPRGQLMSRWFHMRSGSGATARAWDFPTSAAHQGAGADAVVVTKFEGVIRARVRFSLRDSEGRFRLETPAGQFVTIDAEGDVVLGPVSPGDARQLWRWGPSGRLINGQTGLAAAFVASAEGEKLTTRVPEDGDPTQAWNPFASGPPDNSPVALFNSYTVDSLGNTYYQIGAINGAQLGTGVLVVSAPMTPNVQGQLCSCVPCPDNSGYNTIACVENPNLLLTATFAGPVYVAAPL